MKRLQKTIICLILALAMLAGPAALPDGSACVPGIITAQAAKKKVVKKAKGYYSTENKTGYWASKSYKTKGLKRIYKFNSKHYMSTASYNKMVKALKKKSYKALKKAIGKGKLVKPKQKSCSGGKWDYIYSYGNIWVYVTDNTITLID